MNTLPEDLIGLAEARRLLPSHRPGKRLHVSTLYRWIHAGRLPAWRIGGHYFVSRAGLLELARRVQAPARDERRAAAGYRWAQEELQRQGVIR